MPKKNHPCNVCLQNCVDYCILCETCNSWSHYNCQGIGRSTRDVWRKESDLPFVCTRCRTNDDGTFDFLMGLERLKKAAKKGLSHLKLAARSESLYLEQVTLDCKLHTDFENHLQDKIANTYITHFHCSKSVALHSTPDGDCLFNSVSILLCGNENRSVELRYRCCVEMAVNKHKIISHSRYARFELISPDYDECLMSCTKQGSYSSMWRIIAISNFLNLPIQVVYPNMNGYKHIAFQTMNILLRPPFADPENGQISLLWSHTKLPKTPPGGKKEWSANHIVPLVENINRCAVVNMTTYFQKLEKTTLKMKSDIQLPVLISPEKDNMSHLESITDLEPETRKQNKSGSDQSQLESLDPARGAPDHVSEIGIQYKSANEQSSLIDLNPMHDAPDSMSVSGQQNKSGSDQSPFMELDPACGAPDHVSEIGTQYKSANEQSSLIDLNPMHDAPDSMSVSGQQNKSGSDQSPFMELDPARGAPDMLSEDLTTENETVEQSHVQNLSIIKEEQDIDFDVVNDHYDSANRSGDISISDESDCSITEGFTPGPLKTFYDINATIALFRGPHFPLPEIPTGRKDGMYFFIDQVSNCNRRENGEHAEFWDDCGAWSKPSHPKTMFVRRNDKLILVVIRDGSYCTEKQQNKKKVHEPLEPQPVENDILIVKRIYQTLKANNKEMKFRRRISWFTNVPICYSFISTSEALVEYIGEFPPRQLHGNAKHSERNKVFIKTKPKTMRRLKDELKHQGVKKVEKDMNIAVEDDFDKQRDYKQLKNLKYNLDKDGTCRSNAADNVLAVEEMVKSNEFVQSVTHLKGLTHPAVTLFNQQQIFDIKRFCCTPSGTVLGMDKTYNLGDFFVTPTTYKDLSVIRRSTMDHPICFGPTFIHTNSSTKTYCHFLHQIADNLTEDELTNLVIGSDEELAFKNAIKRCFPNSTHVLCTRHLRNNIIKYMEDNAKLNAQERNAILASLFGELGLVYSQDQDTLNQRIANAKSAIPDRAENTCLVRHLEQRVIPLLKHHVIEPVMNNRIHVMWTSNNAESANHVLKAASNWKAQDLCKFIKTWQTIVEAEYKERERALRDMGNFKLSPPFLHHLVPIDSWAGLCKEQQMKRIRKFKMDKGRKLQNEVVSTNGLRTVVTTPTAGKKPHQTKRKRAERTRTPASKRRLIE